MKTNWPALRTGFLTLRAWPWAQPRGLAQTQELAGATTTPAVISSVAILQSAMQRARRARGGRRQAGSPAPHVCKIPSG